MSMNPNMANREVADLVLLTYKDKKPYLNIDFANVTTTGFTANRVFATGGQGAPNRVGFDSERAGTLTINTQIMPVKLLALLSGQEIAKSCKSFKREVVTADSTGKITLANEPKAGSLQLYLAGDDCGVEVTATSLTGKEITGATADTNYIAYYFIDRAEGVQSVRFNASKFPRAFEVRGSTPYKTEDDEIVETELVYYKAQPQAAFTLNFQNTGDPTTLELVFDCFANGDGDIYDMNFLEA